MYDHVCMSCIKHVVHTYMNVYVLCVLDRIEMKTTSVHGHLLNELRQFSSCAMLLQNLLLRCDVPSVHAGIEVKEMKEQKSVDFTNTVHRQSLWMSIVLRIEVEL